MEYKPVPAINDTTKHYKIGVFQNCSRSAKLLRYKDETHELSKMNRTRDGSEVKILMKIRTPVLKYGEWGCQAISSEGELA